MDMNPINTPKSFRDAVLVMLDQYSGKHIGSLEEYLRSLWQIFDKYQSEMPSYTLFLQMLEEAFQAEPAEFDPQWLQYDKPLDWCFCDGVYVLNVYRKGEIVIVKRDVHPLRILKHTVLFQVADLYKMRDNQLKEEGIYFGIQSPTNNRWYNFDVFTYLECGTRGTMGVDGDKRREYEFTSCDWTKLADVLEMGRLYE